MPDIDMDEPEMLESVQFILLAHNPYFTREKQTVDFSCEAGGLHFPLAVTDTGSDVGYRVIEYIKIIENDGTKEAGCKAVLEAIFTFHYGRIQSRNRMNLMFLILLEFILTM